MAWVRLIMMIMMIMIIDNNDNDNDNNDLTSPSSARARHDMGKVDNDDDDDNDNNDNNDNYVYLPLLSEGQAWQGEPQAQRCLPQQRWQQPSASASSSRTCSRTGGSVSGTRSWEMKSFKKIKIVSLWDLKSWRRYM